MSNYITWIGIIGSANVCSLKYIHLRMPSRFYKEEWLVLSTGSHQQWSAGLSAYRETILFSFAGIPTQLLRMKSQLLNSRPAFLTGNAECALGSGCHFKVPGSSLLKIGVDVSLDPSARDAFDRGSKMLQMLLRWEKRKQDNLPDRGRTDISIAAAYVGDSRPSAAGQQSTTHWQRHWDIWIFKEQRRSLVSIRSVIRGEHGQSV